MLYSKRGVRYLRIRFMRSRRKWSIDWGLVAIIGFVAVTFASILLALSGVSL